MSTANRRTVLNLGLLMALAGLLAACGSSRPTGSGLAMGGSQSVPGITCAPFARELSGIALYGEAPAWWSAAGGRYERGRRPVVGSVLAFRATSRLRSGHLSVVSRVLDRRQVMVTHANWVPGSVDIDQLVIDVSERNDWTEVRVWYPPTGQIGTRIYPTYGFIQPDRPATSEELARAIPAAARFALDTAGRPPPRARLRS